MCCQLPLRLRHVVHLPHDGEGHDQEQLLRHVLSDLPGGHGDVQQGALLGQLPHPGHRQVLQAHPGDGAWGPSGQEEVSAAQVPVHPDDRGRGGDVHVQGRQQEGGPGRGGAHRGGRDPPPGQPHMRWSHWRCAGEKANLDLQS